MVFDGGEHEPMSAANKIIDLVEWSEALMDHYYQNDFPEKEFELRPLLMRNRY